jgi:hypothetical protein
LTDEWRVDILTIHNKNQALAEQPITPDIEQEESELARSIFLAEPDISGNHRTVQGKGFQDAPKFNGKAENRNMCFLLTGF